MTDYKPITGELRGAWIGQDVDTWMFDKELFDRLCDRIDAIHAQLERENAALKAELDCVRGKQEEHAHTMGESITDELREYAEDWDWLDTGAERAQDRIEAIADRIDAEHERECKEQYACGAEHGIGASIDASMIQTHGYIELPKDADGEYIHIGDEMRDDWNEQNQGEVEWLILDRHGWWFRLNNSGERFYANEFHEWRHRHHHAQTVEDVLREFALKVAGEECMTMRTGVVEEYAAKLREVLGE